MPKKSKRQTEEEPIGYRNWAVYKRCIALPEGQRESSKECEQLMEKLAELHTIEITTTSDRAQVWIPQLFQLNINSLVHSVQSPTFYTSISQ